MGGRLSPGEPLWARFTVLRPTGVRLWSPTLGRESDPSPLGRASGLLSDLILAGGGGGGNGHLGASESPTALCAGGVEGASGTGGGTVSFLLLRYGFTFSPAMEGCLLVAIFLSLSGDCLRLRAHSSNALRLNNSACGDMGAVGEHCVVPKGKPRIASRFCEMGDDVH